MAFLDPSVTIATCEAKDCVDCPVSESVQCHFRPVHLIYFLLISIPGFLVGGAGILTLGIFPLVIWIAIIVGFFGFVEIRVMCSHCPHYAGKGTILRCWANHGSPKLWKYRPGPMSTIANVVFIGGIIAVWVYPLVFLILERLWLHLGLYGFLTAGFFGTLKMAFCSKCMNFACPLNGIPDSVRVYRPQSF